MRPIYYLTAIRSPDRRPAPMWTKSWTASGCFRDAMSRCSRRINCDDEEHHPALDWTHVAMGHDPFGPADQVRRPSPVECDDLPRAQREAMAGQNRWAMLCG